MKMIIYISVDSFPWFPQKHSTHLEANMFQAFPTMLSRGLSRARLLLTSVADFSYLLKGTGHFQELKASAGGSQEV